MGALRRVAESDHGSPIIWLSSGKAGFLVSILRNFFCDEYP